MSRIKELNNNVQIAKRALALIRKEEKYFQEQKELEEKKKTIRYNRVKNKQKYAFTEEDFDEKVRRDFFLFEAICKKALDDFNNENTNEIYTKEIGRLINISKYLYEEVNIPPSSMFRMSLKESNNKLNQEAHRILVEYLRNNYFKLSKNRRLQLYSEENLKNVLEEIENREISENDIELVVQQSQKKILFDNYIDRIIFPNSKKEEIIHEIKTSKENEIYETDKIEAALENYEIVKSNLAKMFSMLV